MRFPTLRYAATIAALALSTAACDREPEPAPTANTTEVSTREEGTISDAMVTNIGVSEPEGNAAAPEEAMDAPGNAEGK